MIPILFAAFLFFSMIVALIDWRRGWLLAIIVGVVQDPARKLTPGTPVAMSLSIVLVYAAILFAAQGELKAHAREFAQRFSGLYQTILLLFLFLILAALNGVATFGLENWKLPALSFFIYCIPFPAVILGYAYLQREEQLIQVFRFYSILTTLALIGTPLEYFHVAWRTLGTVAIDSNLRFITGFSIRLLAGFYRGPDIMGWHAATLASIGLLMTMRRKTLARVWPWMIASGWGFLNCLLSGRRKALYMIAVFAAVLLWRYVRRLKVTDYLTFLLVALVIGGVMHKVSSNEESSVYTRGAETSRHELFGRLEGGLSGTVEQYGFMGAGLGSATQGSQHLAVGKASLGWQEGGLGKLAVELGIPGVLSVALLIVVMFRVLLELTAHPDVPESSQLLRAGLFALFVADAVTFMVSAQAYSDPLLTMFSAFTLGCLLATASLDERARDRELRSAAPMLREVASSAAVAT
ncbi:MAG: hypothetical protein ABIP63_03470 [Thermoanaerobaculia bacterium]